MGREIFQTGDIFASYYSILLIFLVGLNRCAVYTMPWLMKHFFQRFWFPLQNYPTPFLENVLSYS